MSSIVFRFTFPKNDYTASIPWVLFSIMPWPSRTTTTTTSDAHRNRPDPTAEHDNVRHSEREIAQRRPRRIVGEVKRSALYCRWFMSPRNAPWNYIRTETNVGCLYGDPLVNAICTLLTVFARIYPSVNFFLLVRFIVQSNSEKR